MQSSRQVKQFDNKKMKIVLASNSPRRKELLGGLGVDFEVRTLNDIDESYPDTLPAQQVSEYITGKKADAYEVADGEIIITADTVVVVNDNIFGKPADALEAKRMLRAISGKTHQVMTSVCIASSGLRKLFTVTTDVTFRQLTDGEIDYYVDTFRPLDKAGAYGIQEWIGYIGVTSLNGSYYNVMGFPVQRVYEVLRDSFGVTFHK